MCEILLTFCSHGTKSPMHPCQMKKLLKVMLLNDDFRSCSQLWNVLLITHWIYMLMGAFHQSHLIYGYSLLSINLLNLQGPFDWEKFWNKSMKMSTAYFLSMAHHGCLTEWAQCLLVFNPIISFNFSCTLWKALW